MRTFFFNGSRWLIVIMFTYAAISKVADFSNFKLQLRKSPVLSQFSSYISVIVPIIEIIISILLISSLAKYRILGYYMSWFVLSVFTIYLLFLLSSSYNIPCSCGGILGNLPWDVHIYFNLFFIIISGIGVLGFKTHN